MYVISYKDNESDINIHIERYNNNCNNCNKATKFVSQRFSFPLRQIIHNFAREGEEEG